MARVLIHVPFLLACRLPVSSPKSKKILEEVTMSTVAIVTIAFFALGIIVAIGVGVWLYASNRRTKQLRAKFGPEYNRMARAEGDTPADVRARVRDGRDGRSRVPHPPGSGHRSDGRDSGPRSTPARSRSVASAHDA